MTKAGKRPLSERPERNIIPQEQEFNNRYRLDPELKKHLKEKGLEFRFVSYKKLVDNGGYHENGWVAYNKERDGGPAIMGVAEFAMGSEPTGLIRRGSDVLAVRTKATSDRHRAELARKNAAYKNYDKSAASQLRGVASEGVQIHEGYEEN